MIIQGVHKISIYADRKLNLNIPTYQWDEFLNKNEKRQPWTTKNHYATIPIQKYGISLKLREYF